MMSDTNEEQSDTQRKAPGRSCGITSDKGSVLASQVRKISPGAAVRTGGKRAGVIKANPPAFDAAEAVEVQVGRDLPRAVATSLATAIT